MLKAARVVLFYLFLELLCLLKAEKLRVSSGLREVLEFIGARRVFLGDVTRLSRSNSLI